jgi:hypothetical protein
VAYHHGQHRLNERKKRMVPFPAWTNTVCCSRHQGRETGAGRKQARQVPPRFTDEGRRPSAGVGGASLIDSR